MNPYAKMLKPELKFLGHALLDEYIALDTKRTPKDARQHAYTKLGAKLNRMYGQNHFGKMESNEQITGAISMLRRMIKSRKKRIEYDKGRGEDVFLPQREIQRAHEELRRLKAEQTTYDRVDTREAESAGFAEPSQQPA